jgi:hypothetical protein
MRKTLYAAVSCLAAAVVFAASGEFQPLKVKTGLWEITETVTWTGLPPQAEAMMKSETPTRTYKSCVKTKDLNTNPWAEGSREKCTWTVLNSTGTDMEVQGTSCELGKNYGMTANVRGKIHVLDSEHGTGSMTVILTGNGQTMNGHGSYTGKFVAATCPASLN